MRISRNILIVYLGLFVLLGCEKKDVIPPTTLVRIYLSSSPLDSTVGSVDFSRFNFIQTIYSKANSNDSTFTNEDYNNDEDYFSYLQLGNGYNNHPIDTAGMPYGTYNSLTFFRYSPPSSGKLFIVYATIGKTSFAFWNGTKFTLNFSDSLLTVSKGEPINLLLSIDLNKALNPELNGIDYSKAIDGNGDGTISIEPSNLDGNAALADSIFSSIVRNCSIKRLK